MAPRLELIDAVDVDGDSYGELLFRQYSFDEKSFGTAPSETGEVVGFGGRARAHVRRRADLAPALALFMPPTTAASSDQTMQDGAGRLWTSLGQSPGLQMAWRR